MKHKSLYTRHEAAVYLESKLPSKTSPQWLTFLMDNARGKVMGYFRVQFQRSANRFVIYKQEDLDKLVRFISKNEQTKKVVKETKCRDTAVAFGLGIKENENQYGQCFGYKWKGAQVNEIVGNEDDSPNATTIQMIIDSPLRVSALTTAQAEEFANEILAIVARVKRAKVRV